MKATTSIDPQRLGLVSARLLYFLKVVQKGSIRRAAEELAVAPSAISRSIRQLEDDMGTPLFERVRQRLRLTSAGETLAYHARASQRELGRACTFIEDLQGLRRGRISIVAVESVARGLLPEVLASFWKRYPNVTVEIRTAGSEEALEALTNGACDLAIAFDAPLPRKAKRLSSAHLNLGALLAPSHPLAGHVEGLRLRDFRGDRILLADNMLTLGRLLEELSGAVGVDFHKRVVSTSIHSLIALACAGQGVTFQTRAGIEHELREGRLRFIPLLDTQLKPRRLSLIAPLQGQLSEGPATLAMQLAKAIASLDEQDAQESPERARPDR
jgi:DNA-binding transcriptional LysR family regulator